MQPSEFIRTVPHLNDQDATDAARAYPVVTGHILEASTVNGVLTDLDFIDVVYDIAHDKTHSCRIKMLGVYTGLIGNHPFNFIQSTITGQRAIDQLNWLIDIGLPEHAIALTQFRDIMIWRANVVSYPMASLTLHETMIIRGTCPTKPVIAVNGWVKITTTADSPLHNPRLRAFNPRTEQWQWVNNIRAVSNRGNYDAQVPREWLGAELVVDDPYGVVA